VRTRVQSTQWLVPPDFSKEFVVHTDASSEAIGGMITQWSEKQQKFRPVQFYSHRLNDVERRYHTVDEELLAVIKCLQKWQPWLINKHFTLLTDHRNLLGLIGPRGYLNLTKMSK